MTENQLKEAVHYIRSVTSHNPKVAIILGSGLGDLASLVTIEALIPYTDIPYYPVSSVTGHAGNLIFGYLKEGRKTSPPLLIFQGRVHYYECRSIEKVVSNIRLASELGVDTAIITNAAGGINKMYKPGDIMLIRDFINFSFLQLPKDLYNDYNLVNKLQYPDDFLLQHFYNCALKQQLILREGTYCWVLGPSYETAAEIEMFRTIGVDAVGMSTVPEIYTATTLKMRTIAFSLISNLATGISHTKLSHKEVTETADNAKEQLIPFMKRVLLTMEV